MEKKKKKRRSRKGKKKRLVLAHTRAFVCATNRVHLHRFLLRHDLRANAAAAAASGLRALLGLGLVLRGGSSQDGIVDPELHSGDLRGGETRGAAEVEAQPVRRHQAPALVDRGRGEQGRRDASATRFGLLARGCSGLCGGGGSGGQNGLQRCVQQVRGGVVRGNTTSVRARHARLAHHRSDCEGSVRPRAQLLGRQPDAQRGAAFEWPQRVQHGEGDTVAVAGAGSGPGQIQHQLAHVSDLSSLVRVEGAAVQGQPHGLPRGRLLSGWRAMQCDDARVARFQRVEADEFALHAIQLPALHLGREGQGRRIRSRGGLGGGERSGGGRRACRAVAPRNLECRSF